MEEIYKVSITPSVTKNGKTSTDHIVTNFYDSSTAIAYLIEAVREIFDHIVETIDIYGELEYPEIKKEQVFKVLEEHNEYTFECKEHLNYSQVYHAVFKIQKIQVI